MKQQWSKKMVDTVIKKDKMSKGGWSYEYGLMLLGIERVWKETKEDEYLRYIKKTMDRFLLPDGTILGYEMEDYNIDQINQGKMFLTLYQYTQEQRYKTMADKMMEQLKKQPRIEEGGFWHKKIYPNQMWLDGIYMAAPFYARYSKMFNYPEGMDDVAHQIILINKHTKDSKTGLLYHAWDASKEQAWADPETGCSPHFWGRAMGWYGMAIVDTLDYFPTDHPKRSKIIEILSSMIEALLQVQDEKTSLWYQVLDQGSREGNYIETSGSSMFIYTIAKAVRKGYISSDAMQAAKKAYKTLVEKFITEDDQGFLSLHSICRVAGLGGSPYRDGSYEYYINETVVADDYKGVGPFVKASVEIEKA